MPLAHRRCTDCDRIHDLVSYSGELTSLAEEHEEDVENLSCPECGGDNWVKTLASYHEASAAQQWSDSFKTGGAYPYFNAGLQCMVRSDAHLKQLCAEKGLVAVEGDIDLESHWNREFTQQDKDRKESDDLMERYRNDPMYREAYYNFYERGEFKKDPRFAHLE